jgi:hypothetical protein
MWLPHISKTQRRVVGKIDSVWPISNAAKIEKITDSSVRAQKPLGLMRGFESPHTSLSDPGWLM